MADYLALYGERLDRELGTGDRTNLFTTARRKDAINQGQLEFAKQTGCYVRWIDLALTDGVAEVDLDATSALADGDFLDFSIEPAEYVYTDSAGVITSVSGDDEFPRRDITDLNRHEPGWRNADASQTPSAWYVRENAGSTYIGLYPAPSITAGDSAVRRHEPQLPQGKDDGGKDRREGHQRGNDQAFFQVGRPDASLF